MLMLSCIKELDIMSRRKLFRAEFQKTQTQMTSFLVPLRGAVLGQSVAIDVPSNSEIARSF